MVGEALLHFEMAAHVAFSLSANLPTPFVGGRAALCRSSGVCQRYLPVLLLVTHTIGLRSGVLAHGVCLTVPEGATVRVPEVPPTVVAHAEVR